MLKPWQTWLYLCDDFFYLCIVLLTTTSNLNCFNHWYFQPKPQLTHVTVATHHRSVSFKSVKMVLDVSLHLLVVSQIDDGRYCTHVMSTKCAFRLKSYGCGCTSFKVMSSPVFVPFFWDTLYYMDWVVVWGCGAGEVDITCVV